MSGAGRGRQRERARRKEGRWVCERLRKWIDVLVARRGWYSVDGALRLAGRLKAEYLEKHGSPAPGVPPHH